MMMERRPRMSSGEGRKEVKREDVSKMLSTFFLQNHRS